MFHKVSKVVLYDRCNTFARFSEDGLHVSRQAQHFGGVHVHLCGKRSTLGVYCCVLLANHIVGAASSGDNVQLAWRAWDIARASF